MPLPDAPDYSKRIYELLKETDLENLSYAQFQGVAEKLFIEPENEDEMRRLVLVQLARMAVRGDWDGFLTGGGGSTGAPTDAEYVVMALNGTLTNERVLAAGTGISLTDGGAGSNATIANTGVTSNVAGTGISVSSATGASTIANTGVTSLGAGDGITLSGSTGGVTVSSPIIGDLVAAQYVTLATDTQLQNERVLTAGSGITLTDGGAGSTITIAASGGGGSSIPWNVVNTKDNINAAYTRHLISKKAPFGSYGTGTSTTGSVDTPQCRPFISPISGDVTEIGINCTTADGSGVTKLQIGIYSDSNGAPDSLLTTATMVSTATGSVFQTSFTGTAALDAGTQYWYMWVRNNNTNSIGFTAESNSSLIWLGGSSTINAFMNQQSVLSLSGSDNTLPATVTQTNLTPSFYGSIKLTLKIA